MTDPIPTFDQILRVGPISVIILGVLVVGAYITYFLMSKHIADLKEWINSLNKDKE